MKKLIFALVSLFPLQFVFSQITIMQNDLAAIYAIDQTFTTSVDSSGSVDIGSTGATSWNFSSLVPETTFVNTVVNPGGTPFESDFPQADIAQFSTQELEGATVEFWIYNSLTSDAFEAFGSGIMASIFGITTTIISKNVPAQIVFKLPLTEGTTWSFTDSIIIVIELDGVPLITVKAELSSTNAVDAYGTMILPGGRTVDALRIRQDQVLKTELSPGVPPVRERTVTYSFASKIGELVSVVTPDTVSTFGVVSGVVSWTIPGTKTKVESDELIPANFSLAQNYPNPFNPVTVINYELDKTAEVELAIFNLLGQKIRVLVHETKAKGSHSVQWNGKDDTGNPVSTGFYAYRLKTAKASISKKMILLE